MITLLLKDIQADPAGWMFLLCFGGPAGILILWFLAHVRRGELQEPQNDPTGLSTPTPMPVPVPEREERPAPRYRY